MQGILLYKAISTEMLKKNYSKGLHISESHGSMAGIENGCRLDD
jgi:hypothetical protein